MPFFDVTINNQFTDPSAPTKSSTTTHKPFKTTGSTVTKTTSRTWANKTASTKPPTKAPANSHATRTTNSGMNDLHTDSTNKRTTTAAPNNTATKGYKLENNTDDEVRLTSIRPINVPTSTTEVSVKDVDLMFDPIIEGVEPSAVTFGPLISVTDNLIPNHSMVDPLSIENGTIPWPAFENISVICQFSGDCPSDEICIYGQCKGLCGPHKQNNCFSGTPRRDIFCKYILCPSLILHPPIV